MKISPHFYQFWYPRLRKAMGNQFLSTLLSSHTSTAEHRVQIEVIIKPWKFPEPLLEVALRRCSHEKMFYKICSKFTREHPCRSVITIKLLCHFIDITFQYGCSPVNLLYIYKTPFYKDTYRGLLCATNKTIALSRLFLFSGG